MGSTSQHANVLGYAMNNDLTAPLFKSLLGANTLHAIMQLLQPDGLYKTYKAS